MTASIVTINWNGVHFLDTLFKSLRLQTLDPEEYEIVMVDNGSSDNSVEYVARLFPEVKIVKNSRNDGFAGGCNIGFKNSKGKYIVLVNNDMELDKNWLKYLVEAADKSVHQGMSG